MDKCKIYTLNVNGFRQDSIDNFKNLIEKINISDNDILILQEIPHKELNKKTKPWMWNTLLAFEKFQQKFNGYKVILPMHLVNSNQCTVAICTDKSKWQRMECNEKIKYDSGYSYGNKLVEVQYDNKKCQLQLLGLHMNPCEKMWDIILNSERKNKHTFIIGDFNAYEYRGEMKNMPIHLRNLGFNPLISSNTITYFNGNSSVDNIYVSSSFDFEKDIVVKVENISNVFKTDHALCSVEFGI